MNRIARLLVLAACLVTPLHAAPKQKPEPTPVPPPMAVTQNFSIFQGRSVEIPLRAIGRAPGQLEFIIRSRPRHGRLGPIRVNGRKSAVVTYTHDERAGAGSDSFSFAVQAIDSPVSAAARVQITISEEPPAMAVVHAVDFGSVWLGETREEEITLRNSGGGSLVGKMIVPQPWRVLGPVEYALGRHQERRVRLLYAPESDGTFTAKLVFSHDARSSVHLTGTANRPITLTPSDEIELTAPDGGTMRSGAVVVTNRTPNARVVEITLPDQIQGPDQITLAPGEETRVPLHTAEGFSGTVNGTLEIDSGGYRAGTTLRAYALPPRISVTPTRLAFEKSSPDHPQTAHIELRNLGGSEAVVVATAPAGLRIDPPVDALNLAPGDSRQLTVHFEPTGPDALQGTIAFETQGAARVEVPVSAPAGGQPSAPGLPTALLVPGPTPNPADAPSKIPPIRNIQTIAANRSDIDLAWERPSPDVRRYVAEIRRIEIAPGGKPNAVWKECRDVTFVQDANRSIAQFRRLPTGQTLFFRIRSVDAENRLSPPSEVVALAVPRPNWGRWMPWLAGLIGIAAIIYIALRARQSRREGDTRDAERIARLDSP